MWTRHFEWAANKIALFVLRKIGSISHMIRNIFLIIILMSISSIDYAGDLWKSPKDITIQRGTHFTMILNATSRVTNKEVGAWDYCMLRHDEKAYDRKIEAGSKFDVQPVQRTMVLEPSLDDLFELAFVVDGVDHTDQIKSKDELKNLLSSEGVTISQPPANGFLKYTIQMKSLTTSKDYVVSCHPGDESLTEEQLINLFRTSGAIAPADAM